jgi:hydroxyacylglutathione hydrolase
MIFECLPNGMFGSNCFIIGQNGEGVIIDCGADSNEIMDVVKKNGIIIKSIILTHGHIDHICSVDEVRKKTRAKVLIHEDDAITLTDPAENGSAMFGRASTFEKADMLLKDGDVIEEAGLSFEIINTPGHTPGCICIKLGDIIFTGDTLFKYSVGRTDLSRGNQADLITSIRNKLYIMEDEIVAYPGHGESTTIGFEKRNNSVIRI